MGKYLKGKKSVDLVLFNLKIMVEEFASYQDHEQASSDKPPRT